MLYSVAGLSENPRRNPERLRPHEEKNVFRQARVEDIGHRRITKAHGQIVVVTLVLPEIFKTKLDPRVSGSH